MNDDGLLGQALGQLGSVAKDTGKQIAKVPSDLASDLEKQLGEASKQQDQDEKQTTNETGSDDKTKDVVKSFYETSDDAKKNNLDKKAIEEDEFRKQIKDKSPEEQKKLIQLRQQLHKQTYYDPTFNPPKKQEERPAEKIEKEENEKKQMDALEFEEKKKKELPPSVKQGTHEKVLGISG